MMDKFLEPIVSTAKNLVFLFFPFHAAAWQASADSVKTLLNEPDDKEKDRLTLLWRDCMQSQLSSVAITVCLE